MKQTRKKVAQIGVSLFVLMGSLWAPTTVIQQPAYAISQTKPVITQSEAVKIAKSLITIPADAKNEQVRFEPARPQYGQEVATWSMNWEANQDSRISVSIDAESGKLVDYYTWDRKAKLKTNSNEIPEAAAEKTANEFLQKVAKDEVAHLSKANEFADSDPYSFNEIGMKSFHYTRIENGIPFLENGFYITVDANAQVVRFSRTWSIKALPDPKPKLSAEEGEKQLLAAIKPSLRYERISELAGGRSNGSAPSLVFQYGPSDPLILDAQSGKVLTTYGQESDKAEAFQTLGSTVSTKQPGSKEIGITEAQKIAEGWIKKFPGKYRSEGSHGGGSSSNSDGTTTRSWRFSFSQENSATSNKAGEISIEISDRGELVGYEDESKESLRYGSRADKVDSPVPWQAAKQTAIDFIKLIYPDRLGEIYLESQEPTAETLKQLIDEDRENYRISFGWTVNGIPIENNTMEIEVDPKDGNIIGFDNHPNEKTESIQTLTAQVGAKQAVEVESKQKKVMLTYFQPGIDYRSGQASVDNQPILAYRLVGDNGVVDAVTGKWVSFNELSKQSVPQDIAEHVNKEALEFAISQGILKVKDGKVEPDKAVTRIEFIRTLISATNRVEFHSMYRSGRLSDELVIVSYQDVSKGSSDYEVVQQAVKYGFLTQTSSLLQPDQPITRIEAATLSARLFGLDKLLQQKDIFKTPYTDVAEADVPAVALAYAYDLFPAKTDKHLFQPTAPVTRADIAVWYQKLLEEFSEDQ